MSTNRTYLVLAVILLLLSVGGIVAFFYFKPSLPVSTTNTNTELVKVPTKILTPTLVASPSSKPSITPKPSSVIATPSAKVTPKITFIPKPSPTLTPTPSIKVIPTPTTTVTSDMKTLQSTTNKFQVLYSSFRTLYQDKEPSGDRYTLYSSQGNFAIHVGPSWSWVNTSRQFSSTVTVAGQNTFVYEISTQKIVDFEANGLKYTIQCVHNNLDTLKKECDKLLTDFTLTK